MSQPWERVVREKHRSLMDDDRMGREVVGDLILTRWSDEAGVPDTGRRGAKNDGATASASSVSG